MDRVDIDQWFLEIAKKVGERSTCLRHKIGCIAVVDNHIVSMGYNGAVRQALHCIDIGCLRDELHIQSGKNTEICRAVHAEQNVIIQAAVYGISIKDSTIYCTHSPCILCTKMLINVQIRRYVFCTEYNDKEYEILFKRHGIIVERRII